MRQLARLEQERSQSAAIPNQQQQSGQIVHRPADQQFIGESSSFQQLAPAHEQIYSGVLEWIETREDKSKVRHEITCHGYAEIKHGICQM